MKSKLLQKQSYGVIQSRKVLDDQQENTKGSSMPWKGHVAPPIPINPAVDVEARQDSPNLPKHGCRPARS
jgi:hypothetical protein